MKRIRPKCGGKEFIRPYTDRELQAANCRQRARRIDYERRYRHIIYKGTD